MMPQLTVEGKTVDVAEGTRLVLAIEEQGVHIGHRCGGHARCTTCRVQFAEGEPSTMTRAEYAKLSERELLGTWRLACQISCDQAMVIGAVAMTKESQGWDDSGPAPDPSVQPEAVWLPIDELKGG
jgi:ferredoxin